MMLRRTYCMLLLAICCPAIESSAAPVKNVLFIISDDLKASALGCYGNAVCKTPHIDRLAREGMVFEQAYCQGTMCGPSRRSFMFSRYRGKSTINLGEHLKNNGLYTARVGKIYHMRVPGDIIAGSDGEDEPSSWTERFNSQGEEAHTPGAYACLNLNIFTNSLENRQSTRMPHRMFVSVESQGDGSEQPDHKSATKAMQLLDQHQGESFFLAVGFVRPHYPMVQPPRYFELYPWQEIALPATIPHDWDDIPRLGLAATRSQTNPIGEYPDNQKRMWSAYYASVTFMDEQVGRILDHLAGLGLREQTAVVFTSDHGYHLGEHGFWQKSNLHEEVLRVPLIISAPGYKPGRSKSLVELVDLFPTVSELVGHAVPPTVQGTSLVPILRNPQHVLRQGALSLNKGYSWRTRDWHFMRYQDGSTELYDVHRDPHEFHNLSSDPVAKEIQQDLDRQLNARLAELQLNQ